ncbi:FAD-binding oxidoreductase [Kitasatospora sp. MAP5-34]|uniref:FAD-binding oxidoreductase n=1 Tax=Kitasatospora sp. MAP5-34 TaxID=3035102 RepID=UPI0024764E49|nr:FAD-binding oxidoreductase [Kitasatospora sp. MAP5-34]MDH6576188.1 FAD/FMN-containing dehydrogenase [Kitasatospora sp. MAP5-34]
MTIDRREFLAALGLGGAMVVSGACGEVARAATRGVARSAAPVPPPDWSALKARLAGRLLLPGDQGYGVARLGYNELYDGLLPAAVARCTSAADVRTCLDAARGHGVPIAARSGGHSYLGYSVPNGGLVMDLRAMAQVQVRSDGTVQVGAGARLIEVYAALAQAGRLLPAGSCPTVGVSGLTLGGGIGVLTRKYGLTCDRLVSAEVVTADSRVLTASECSEPDLYWALRGGGGGNFGVVTRFTFSTEPAPALTVFALRFPAGSAASVVGAWQQWVADAPPELWSNCVVSSGTPPTLRVGGCYVGAADALNPLLDQLIAAAATQPSSRTVQGKNYLDAMKYMAGCANDTIAQCHPTFEGGRLPREAFVAVSRVLNAPLDAQRVVQLMTGRTGVDLLLDSLGGAVSELAPDETAFPHRSALASAQIYASTTPAGKAAATAAVDAVRDGLAALGATGTYVNYIDASLPDWGTAYYGENLPRLKAVSRQYDPDQVFTFPQSVASA